MSLCIGYGISQIRLAIHSTRKDTVSAIHSTSAVHRVLAVTFVLKTMFATRRRVMTNPVTLNDQYAGALPSRLDTYRSQT